MVWACTVVAGTAAHTRQQLIDEVTVIMLHLFSFPSLVNLRVCWRPLVMVSLLVFLALSDFSPATSQRSHILAVNLVHASFSLCH